MMTTENALLAEIIANPEDDLCRLVYADWLDENGQTERAAFIRVQILIDQIEYDTGGHTAPKDYLTEESRLWAWIDRYGKLDAIPTDGRWYAFRNRVDFEHYGTDRAVLIRRGFISEIRCTLDEWCGGEECPECVRYEYVRGVPTVQRLLNCRHCHGTGRTIGIGPQVVRKHPVTRVVLTDVEPDRILGTDPEEGALVWGQHSIDRFPEQVRRFVWPHGLRFWHGTREKAVDWLSQALLSWAKSQPVAEANP